MYLGTDCPEYSSGLVPASGFGLSMFEGLRLEPELFFQLGAVAARLCTNDYQLRELFGQIFLDCEVSPAEYSSNSLRVTLCVLASANSSEPILLEISGHDGSTCKAALSSFFPELSLVTISAGSGHASEWICFACAEDPSRVVVAVCGEQIQVDRALPWQRVAAHYFLDHVMRMQPEYFFLHGATVTIAGKGVLLCGSKGAGKSTLYLALAGLGHQFLGDEIAQIHSKSGQLLPNRRAISIRHGPQSAAARSRLSCMDVANEVMPDGTERLRVPVSRIFPDTQTLQMQSAHLAYAFFLAPREAAPRARSFDFSWKQLAQLEIMSATLGSFPLAQRTMRFLVLFGSIQCFTLNPGGTPDQTAALIEKIVVNQ